MGVRRWFRPAAGLGFDWQLAFGFGWLFAVVDDRTARKNVAV